MSVVIHESAVAGASEGGCDSRSWIKEFKGINRSSKGAEDAFCSACAMDFKVAHGGRNDIKKHFATESHKKKNLLSSGTKPLTAMFNYPNEKDKTTKA
ncbi:hypothetical protein MAR_001208 [Mya arenaria]|uniref:BED-type domain-containing protein n=1 Tax=Mya arenaria TaxID=6604 RepID=A0ABY7FB21_MYAAR|nr:hypothetical protein MAR_001208 [Mya arenaria]